MFLLILHFNLEASILESSVYSEAIPFHQMAWSGDRSGSNGMKSGRLNSDKDEGEQEKKIFKVFYRVFEASGEPHCDCCFV